MRRQQKRQTQAWSILPAENAAAAAISLSTEELERLASAVPAGSVAGERYPERDMATIDRYHLVRAKPQRVEARTIS